MILRALFLSSLFLLLSACSSGAYHGSQPVWSDDIPARQYFIDHYRAGAFAEVQSESDYLLWVQRFYLGWELYGRGWLKATEELAQTLSPGKERELAREKALAIGHLVSAEWAKNTRYRVINTRHLNIWGNALNKSVVKKEQLFVLDKILLDVNTLLQRTLAPQEIAYSRYYQVEDFDVEFQ